MYYELTVTAPSWFDSSVGRALHQYRRGHGFESRSSLNFFRLSSRNCLRWAGAIYWSGAWLPLSLRIPKNFQVHSLSSVYSQNKQLRDTSAIRSRPVDRILNGGVCVRVGKLGSCERRRRKLLVGSGKF